MNQADSGRKVVISYGQKKANEVYQILKDYLNKYNGNIYCDVISTVSGEAKYIKYSYFTNDTIFNNFTLENGRILYLSECESDMFLSTKKTGETNQIGHLSEFAGDTHFEFHTLKSNLKTNIFDRSFFIQLDEQPLNSFIADLSEEGIVIQKVPVISNDEYTYSNLLIIAVCFIVLALLVLYDLLNSYKKIAIEKMLGFYSYHIWLKRISPLALSAILATLITTIFLILFKFNTFNSLFITFLNELFKYSVVMILSFILFISFPFLYIKRISISDMLKNKRPIETIVALNGLIKIGFIITFLLLTARQYTQFQIIQARYTYAFQDWEKTRDYAIIPEIQTAADAVNVVETYSEESKIIEKNLFLFFNQRGAIYANFSHYSPESRDELVSLLKDDYKVNYAVVNPNYIKENYIYDKAGNTIDIAETEFDYILLVPEKYHDLEKEIREYHAFLKNGHGIVCEDPDCPDHADHADKKEVSIVRNQRIKIIWTKSGYFIVIY